MNEDTKEIFRMVFAWKTVLYIISGLGLILFSWLQDTLLIISILFSLMGCACIFCASYDAICYLKNKPVLGQWQMEEDKDEVQ